MRANTSWVPVWRYAAIDVILQRRIALGADLHTYPSPQTPGRCQAQRRRSSAKTGVPPA
jgi:hypothetical protein